MDWVLGLTNGFLGATIHPITLFYKGDFLVYTADFSFEKRDLILPAIARSTKVNHFNFHKTE